MGSGLAEKSSFRRSLSSLIPDYIAHVNAKASGFEPVNNQVVLEDGSKVKYDYLVVAPGLEISQCDIEG